MFAIHFTIVPGIYVGNIQIYLHILSFLKTAQVATIFPRGRQKNSLSEAATTPLSIMDHHGYSMNSGHYTASNNCCGKTFHCNDNKITESNITDTYNSSTAYILLYKLMLY